MHEDPTIASAPGRDGSETIGLRLGKAAGALLRILLWGVLVSPSLGLLPWGDGLALVVVAGQVGVVAGYKAARGTAATGFRIPPGDRWATLVFLAVSVSTVGVAELGLRPSAVTIGAVLVAASYVLAQERGVVGLAVTLATVAAAVAAEWLPLEPDVLIVSGEPYSVTQASADYYRLAAAFFLLTVEAFTRERLTESERRAEELEAQRDRAVADERARIARELHDVIAHHVTVMTVQAEGGRAQLTTGHGGGGEEVLAGIATSGRTALTELRRLLGVLRAPTPGPSALAPQPRLSHLDELVAGAGLPASVRVVGDARPLPDGIDLNAYRIVQEALTNARKHGGDDASATVELRYRDDALEVEVVDDGHARHPAVPGSGNGLVGMQERVTLVGGDLEAGPRPGGGYRVFARLPLAGDEVGA